MIRYVLARFFLGPIPARRQGPPIMAISANITGPSGRPHRSPTGRLGCRAHADVVQDCVTAPILAKHYVDVGFLAPSFGVHDAQEPNAAGPTLSGFPFGLIWRNDSPHEHSRDTVPENLTSPTRPARLRLQ